MNLSLLVLACSVFLLLGLGHAGLVLFTERFQPSDSELFERLQTATTRMSGRSTMWRGIKGFHLSHSFGMVVFGVFYLALAVDSPDYLFSSRLFQVAAIAVSAVYVVLAHNYWFNVPRNAFAVALVLFVGAFFL